MKDVRSLLCWVMVMGFVLGQPLMVLAQEHGGKELAGTATPAPAVTDEKATLSEAATALEVIDPALATDLRAWVEGVGMGDKNATLTKVADALGATNPGLAAKVRGLVTKEHGGKEHGGAATT